MKNIQEWLDINYPLEEKYTLEDDKDNFDSKRREIASLEFNSIRLKLFEGDLNFDGFDLLDEISCNLNQLPFFLLNGLNKLPKGVTKIILWILKNDDVNFENIKTNITEKITSTYCKHEVITYANKKGVNETFIKIYFDIGIWRNRYERYLKNIEKGVDSDFLSKQNGIILRLFNEKVQENKSIREENKKSQKHNRLLTEQLEKLGEKNRELQMEKVEIKKEAAENLRVNINTIEDIKEFELKEKEKEVKVLEKEVKVLEDVNLKGNNSIYLIQAREKIASLRKDRDHFKASLKIRNEKYGNLVDEFNKTLQKYKVLKQQQPNRSDSAQGHCRKNSASSIESNISYSRSRQGSFSSTSHTRRPSNASEKGFFGSLFGSRSTSPVPTAPIQTSLTLDTVRANTESLGDLSEETPTLTQTYQQRLAKKSQNERQRTQFREESATVDIEKKMNEIIRDSGNWIINFEKNYQHIDSNEIIFSNLFTPDQNKEIISKIEEKSQARIEFVGATRRMR